MFQWRKRAPSLAVGALVLAAIGLFLLLQPSPAENALPTEISDAEFWSIVEDFSEPNGYFRSENLLSNELLLQDVIPGLKERIPAGGVYIGVGPEQNFTYILALAPRVSFIVDIRRMNLVEHLLYKALFELSEDREEFLSRLFSRPSREGLDANASVEDLFAAFEHSVAEPALFEKNVNDALQLLTETHQFLLSEEDKVQLRYILGRFYQEGPRLSYSFAGSYYQGSLGMPTYKELMLATDSTGRNWGFLSSEEQFRNIQAVERRNLIIPLVGDFAGPRALRSVGQYMRQHKSVLSAFYTSNVEMYLFQQGDDWRRFYANVSTMPMDSRSTFIRFAAGGRGKIDLQTGFVNRSTQLWSPVFEVVEAARNGTLEDYSSLMDISY